MPGTLQWRLVRAGEPGGHLMGPRRIRPTVRGLCHRCGMGGADSIPLLCLFPLALGERCSTSVRPETFTVT